jgi:hypothetical protein
MSKVQTKINFIQHCYKNSESVLFLQVDQKKYNLKWQRWLPSFRPVAT